MSAIVDSRLTNVFFANARVSEDQAGKDQRGNSSLLPKAISRQIDAGRRKQGGLWVGGKAVLTTSTLNFAPNSMNQALHATPENLEISISLTNISNVAVHRGLITDVIEIRTDVGILKIKCVKAKAFAAAIEATRIAAR
ncbi:hypothetical protein ACI51W_34400 (plasmid) [Pseudomonas marginalis]|uniref:hypothetical protein n=1 Tax=Gammaproteobacteria TaxID=1236 RepID=UPI0011EBEEF1|nr:MULTISPECIES: hypothetical protein [Enterobacteriaceae]EFE0813749.1 hypothetical protein [Escherichia coli]EFI6640934.1 hypothetical protein [Escherichia coli]KAA0546456.1 hypothetical protein F0327_26615 [Citrobacter braakii]HAT3429632.1 hypothetical protein [Citrobacter freundii]